MKAFRAFAPAAAAAAVTLLTACGGATKAQPTPAPFTQADFNSGFKQYLANEPTHFQDILGEKKAQDGLTPIFESKIVLAGTQRCDVHNTANDDAMAICTYGSYDKLADAQKAYKIVKERAVAALPDTAQVLEQPGDAKIPVRFIMRIKDAQAIAAIAKNDDTKQYDVGYIFSKAQ